VAEEIELACPQCGQGVAFTPAATAQLLTCPACNGEFIAPAEDGSADLPEEESEIKVPDDELNAMKIRQLAAGRRATYRARSYSIIAAGVCAVAAIQLIWMIVQQTKSRGWGMQCTGYALFTLIAIYGFGYFALRARELHREAKQSMLAEPSTSPDFTALDDGSKRWKNLEDVR
jgi:hypothetical protein